jgi:hypothetical protein
MNSITGSIIIFDHIPAPVLNWLLVPKETVRQEYGQGSLGIDPCLPDTLINHAI